MENRIPKIYFSKSRAGNFDNILKVRNYLSKFNCEVIEFTGGTYTPDKLDSSDFLLILPPDLDNCEFIGRGQYEEFIRVSNNKNKPLPLIITSIDSEGMPYGVVTTQCRIIDKNWITDYGHFFLIDAQDEDPIDELFGLEFKSKFDKIISKEILNLYPDLQPISSIINQLTYEGVFNSLNLL